MFDSRRCRRFDYYATSCTNWFKQGLVTKDVIKILVDEVDIPIIVDAGIGSPSRKI